MQAIGCIVFALLGIPQLVAGWVGADHYVGAFWAGAILIGCIITRFMLPITVFGFLGALNAWEWPWWGALLFTFPGLLIAIPSLLMNVVELLTPKRRFR